MIERRAVTPREAAHYPAFFESSKIIPRSVSDNKLAYAFLLTPTGIAAKLDLTKAFLKHKEFETTRVEIARLKQGLSAEANDCPR